MGEMGTAAGDASVGAFIAGLPDARRAEAEVLDALYRRVTGEDPRLWAGGIVGYGSYAYAYASGRTGTSLRAGFAPRKPQQVLYMMGEWGDASAEAGTLFARLGRHSVGSACVYLKKLSDADPGVLEELIALNWRMMNERYPG